MTRTPQSIARHELNGLAVEIVAAEDPTLVGLAGRVIEESMNTLVVRPGEPPLGDPEERSRRVPKRGTTFAFTLSDGTIVRVDGERLVARPARRTEMGGASPWV